MLSTLRPLSHLIALAALLIAAPAIHANSITYDVTLSPSTGQYGGAGTLTLASAPAAYGLTTYSHANGQLQDLTFVVDGQTFSLAGDPFATVEFLNGQLYNISFAQTVGDSPNRFTLDTSGEYAFYSSNGLAESSGSLAAIPADATSTDSSDSTTITTSTAPTPEPTSLLLLATALLLGGFFLFRNRRSAHS